MVASAVGEVAPRGGVAVCSGEDDGVEDSVVGWEVLAMAACLMTSVRLRRGVVLRTPAPRAVRAEAGSRCRPRALQRCRGPKASRPWRPWTGEKAERKEGLCGGGQQGESEGEGLVWLL